MHLSRSDVIVDFIKPFGTNLKELPSKKTLTGSSMGTLSGKKGLPQLKQMGRIIPRARQRNKISVVVPVFNEINIIKIFHEKLVGALQVTGCPFEIIYIDDHSNDGTYEWLVRQAKKVESRIKNVVRVFKKQGKKGKAFSLMEGFEVASGAIFVMIDSDMQYRPSDIPAMVKRISASDIMVADRKYVKISFIRELFSKTFRYFFGKLLFGLDLDIQSGLKVFRREVYETAKFFPVSPWTFDLEFLCRARYSGFSINNHRISFYPRSKGESKVNIFLTSLEIGFNALLLKFKRLKPMVIPPYNKRSMRGAGIGYKNKKYITHTILDHKESALKTWSSSQIFILVPLIYFLLATAFYDFLLEVRIIVTLLSILYFIDAVFNLYLILKSIKKPIEVSFSEKRLREIDENKLPIYSILCPLYKEANVLPQFLDAIAKMDWPLEKLDVMLLIEEDDRDTIAAIRHISLPYYVRVVTVPHSFPKTKPKACNYGLSFAKGKFLVIYDAEDVPDPLQLKKAYLGFRKLPKNVRCLQAKLNYYNPEQNLLTRFFTAEYSLWFDLTLTGLQSLNSTIPLGGTSNHFRVSDLRTFQGWDPFNVTEDADLGVRLFKKGYKTAIIDSTTMEEANSVFRNWFRQRSRWIKGYIQTYFVHMRDFLGFVRQNGLRHAIIFQLTIGGKLLFLLINPVLWIITIFYFVFFEYTAPLVQLVYYPPMSYLAVTSLVFGNFLFFYYYMLACAKRNQWGLVKYVYLIPIYWVMMSCAGFIALYQLVFRPHYWEKTVHGFHLRNKRKAAVIKPEVLQERQGVKPLPSSIKPVYVFKLGGLFKRLLVSFYYVLFFGADIGLIFYLYTDSAALSYFYLSIIGKSVYVGSQFVSFSAFSVFRKKIRGNRRINYLIFLTFLISWIGVVIFGFLRMGASFVDFGLQQFTIAMMCFAIANIFVLYNLRRRIYTFLVVAYITTFLQLSVIYLTRADISHIVKMTLYLSGAEMLLMFILHLNKEYFRVLENNLAGFFGLLYDESAMKLWERKQMKILIFNWRDTKHVYAGGAEVYVHELAKRWVKQGNKVTMFCGNDNKHVSNEVIDGVEIFRRGGTYTVYLFAFIYYILKFRGKYDLVIDCENGIPFFTPLYVRKPIILVIHHVHQEVIRKYLRFPINRVAAFLEAKFMPILYKNKKIVTVSKSSKEEIIKLGFTDEKNIEIVYNGASVMNVLSIAKTEYPSFLYLGRLQDYKNIDVAIAAFAKVQRNYKEARLRIVGFGESHIKLVKLAERLGISDKVAFLGKVSHEEKARLLSEAWVVLQPSQVEGWGITVIEANACGTPVIASRVHGLRDSVIDGRTGILVEYRNVNRFAKAMEKLIGDSTLRGRLSREAYVWSRNFNWSKSADLFYNVIGRSLPYYRKEGAPAYSDLKVVSSARPYFKR